MGQTVRTIIDFSKKNTKTKTSDFSETKSLLVICKVTVSKLCVYSIYLGRYLRKVQTLIYLENVNILSIHYGFKMLQLVSTPR